MTRRAVFVNLSNWDGEDYEVVKFGYGKDAEFITVKPGASVDIDYGAGDGFGFRPVQRRDSETGVEISKPFMDAEGHQIFPRMLLSIDRE